MESVYKLTAVAQNIASDEFKKQGLVFETHPVTELQKLQYKAISNSMIEFARIMLELQKDTPKIINELPNRL